MTTTPAAISPRHADDDGPAQNADPNATDRVPDVAVPAGSIIHSGDGSSSQADQRVRCGGVRRTSRDLRRLRVPGLTVSGDGRSYRLGDRRHRGDR